MSQRDASGKEPESGPDGMPSDGVRSIITLLLFLQLAAIFIAVASNFASEWRSGLRNQLSRVPTGPYLRALGMNTAFDMNPIYGTSEDWDHSCEILLNVPRGFRDSQESIDDFDKITLMPEDAWSSTRRRRYWMLALQTAMYEGDDVRESLLPQALATGMLNQHGVTDGAHSFRCRAQAQVPMLNIDVLPPEQRDPYHPVYFMTTYDADLIKTPTGWNVSKVGGRNEMTISRSRISAGSQDDNSGNNSDNSEDQ